jgi:hypothetical protein
VYFMSAIIQLFVLLPLCTTVVLFIATSVLPRKDLYDPAVSESLNYDRELSKFAATSALVTAQFQSWVAKDKQKQREWDNNGLTAGSSLYDSDTVAVVSPLSPGRHSSLTTEDCILTEAGLASVLQPALSPVQAAMLASQIFSHGDSDGDGTTTVAEIIDIMSADTCDFGKLQKHMQRKDAMRQRKLEADMDRQALEDKTRAVADARGQLESHIKQRETSLGQRDSARAISDMENGRKP